MTSAALVMIALANAGGRASAFDFTTKGILQDALRKNERWRLADPEGRPPGGQDGKQSALTQHACVLPCSLALLCVPHSQPELQGLQGVRNASPCCTYLFNGD
eukprot:scaffold159399_cov17-Tisochrysis_lutea.AAC.1